MKNLFIGLLLISMLFPSVASAKESQHIDVELQSQTASVITEENVEWSINWLAGEQTREEVPGDYMVTSILYDDVKDDLIPVYVTFLDGSKNCIYVAKEDSNVTLPSVPFAVHVTQ